jgi:hypothetical protein
MLILTIKTTGGRTITVNLPDVPEGTTAADMAQSLFEGLSATPNTILKYGNTLINMWNVESIEVEE